MLFVTSLRLLGGLLNSNPRRYLSTKRCCSRWCNPGFLLNTWCYSRTFAVPVRPPGSQPNLSMHPMVQPRLSANPVPSYTSVYTPYTHISLARTIYIRCIYGIFGREITKYTVIYGVYIRFWPTLHTHTHTHAHLLLSLQLLGGLLESNPGYVQAMESMGLAAQFFEFLSLEHANNNVHNIRLCRQIVAAGSMPVSDLADMQVGDKVGLANCVG